MTAAAERLTALDETLRHTSPTTFDQVATTDPRFFDRLWYSGIPPAAIGGRTRTDRAKSRRSRRTS